MTEAPTDEAEDLQPAPVQDDAATLEAIGRPDEALVKSLEHVPLKEVKARLSLVQAGRLAALRNALEASRASYGRGVLPLNSLTETQIDLALAELDYGKTPASRLAALKSWVAATTRLEAGVRAIRDAGARGGDEVDFYGAVAARLKAEEQLVREHLAERVAKSPRGELAEPTPSRGQAILDLLTKENGVEEALESFGKPDGDFFEDMEHVSLKELQTRLMHVQACRIAALLKRLNAIARNHGFRGDFPTETVTDELQAGSEFNQAKIDYINTPAIRLSSLHALVASTARFETEVRAKREAGARGGESVAFYSVVAARMHAEERLVCEILAQRAVKSTEVESTEPTSTHEQTILELLKGDGVSKTLEAIGQPDEAFFTRMERASVKELEERLTLIRAGRLAALIKRADVIRQFQTIMSHPTVDLRFTEATALQADADLAEAKAECISTPANRLSARYAMVVSTSAMENEVRLKVEAGARSEIAYYLNKAIAVRLGAEEQLIREVLAQRKRPLN
ncbi:MAG: hypothetical protein WCJ09_07580 [Planctomycetota bacterium]